MGTIVGKALAQLDKGDQEGGKRQLLADVAKDGFLVVGGLFAVLGLDGGLLISVVAVGAASGADAGAQRAASDVDVLLLAGDEGLVQSCLVRKSGRKIYAGCSLRSLNDAVVAGRHGCRVSWRVWKRVREWKARRCDLGRVV